MSHPVHTMLGVPATFAIALAAFVYTRGWFRIRRAFPRAISAERLGAMIIGLFSLWIAVGSPLTAFHHELLSVHMVQHVLLMAVAPPFVLMGTPALPLLYGIPWRSARRAFGQLLRC